jgi:hypothetical protein
LRETKISELLRKLPASEFKKFGEFLNSPIHNKSKKNILLYNYFRQFYPNLNESHFNINNISRYIYQKSYGKEQNIRTLLSNFTDLMEIFIELSELENRPHIKNLLQIDSYYKRNMIKLFSLKSGEILRNNQTEFNKDIEFYFYDFMVNAVTNHHLGEDLDRDMDNDYFRLSEKADMLYILSKIKIANTILSRKMTPDKVYKNLWSIDSIINYIETNIENIKGNHPVIFAEYNILMMMVLPQNEHYFNSLKDYAFENINKFKYEELTQMYYSLTNYCVNRISVGEDKYLTNLYTIHRKFEKAGFYMKNTKLHYIDFLAVIICGININNVNWSKYFFDKYKNHIAPVFKEDTIALAQATISFAEKKYEVVTEHISKLSYRYSYFYLKAKEMLIKTYYETGEINLMLLCIDATKQYLKRHKEMLSYHYDRFMQFLNYSAKLVKLQDMNQTDIRFMLKKLDEDRDTIARQWLMDKIIELK